MLRLASADPAWVEIIPAAGDVPAVRVRFAPIGIKTVRAARAAIREAPTDEPWAASDAMSGELLRRGVLDWEGVGDVAGNPLPVTAATIELFLADPIAFEAADRAYVWPWARRDQEKNVSSGSPAGTSERATPGPDTATSPAAGAKTAGAMRPKRARAARTSRAKPKPTPPKTSGA